MNLKKFLCLLLIALSALFVFGCGNEGETTDYQALAEELVSKVGITFAEGDTTTSVTQNITLGTIDSTEATLTWATSNASVSTTGVVTRPAAGQDDVTVTIIATVKFADGSKATKTFTVTVKAEEVIVAPTSTIASVLELTEGSAKVQGTVVGTYARGFILQDETGMILVYTNATPEFALGDVVEVEGGVSVYKDRTQLSKDLVMNKVSTGTAPAFTSTDLTVDNFETLAVLTNFGMQMDAIVTVTSVSGSYVNTLFVGSTTLGVAITYPANGSEYEVGKTYKVTGLFMYSSAYNNVTSAYLMVSAHEEYGFTVSFDTNGGNALEAISFVDPAAVELPTPEKEGSKFLGWLDSEGNAVTAITELKNYELKASWKDTVLYVDAADSTKYATLQAALAVAEAGDTIVLAAGTYAADYTAPISVTVDNLTIVGAGEYALTHTDTFAADETKDSILDLVLEVTAKDFTLKNVVLAGRLSLKGATGLTTFADSVTTAYSADNDPKSIDGPVAVYEASEDLLVDNVVVAGNTYRFVYVQAAIDNVTVNGCTVLDSVNELYDFLRFGMGNVAVLNGDVKMTNNYLNGLQAGFMLRVPSGKSILIANNTFLGVHAAIWFRSGTVPEEGYKVDIIGNVFDGCGKASEDWDVIAVTTSAATTVNVNFNKFVNSDVLDRSTNKDYVIKMRTAAGQINVSDNYFGSEEEASDTYNLNVGEGLESAKLLTSTVFGFGSAETTPNSSYWNSDAQKVHIWLVSKEQAVAMEDTYSWAYRVGISWSENTKAFVVDQVFPANGTVNINTATSDYVLFWNGNLEDKTSVSALTLGAVVYTNADLSALEEGLVNVEFIVGSAVFTLTLVDGEETKTISFKDFNTVELPTPEKENAVFLGWVDGEGNVVTALTENADLTLTASWHLTVMVVDPSDETKYATLQAALEDAQEGDTIILTAGTYSADYTSPISVTVDNLTIVGAGEYALTHADTFAADETRDSILDLVLEVTAKDFTLKNVVLAGRLSLKGATGLTTFADSVTTAYSADNDPKSIDGPVAVYEASEDLLVDNVVVAGNTYRFVYVQAAIDNVTVNECTVLDSVSLLYDFLRFGMGNVALLNGEAKMNGNYIHAVQSAVMDRIPHGTTYTMTNNYIVNTPAGTYFRSLSGVAENITYNISNNVFEGCGSDGWDVVYIGTDATSVVNMYNNVFLNNKNVSSEGCWVVMLSAEGATVNAGGNYIDDAERASELKNITLDFTVTPAADAYTAAMALSKNAFGENLVVVSGVVQTFTANADGSVTMVLTAGSKTFTVYKAVLVNDHAPYPAQNDTVVVSGYLYNYNNNTAELNGDKDHMSPQVLAVTRGTSNISLIVIGASTSELPETELNGNKLDMLVAADEGYTISSVTVNGKPIEGDAEGNYSFVVMGNSEVIVVALAEGEQMATLHYTGTSNGNGTSGNDAAVLGLDATVFNVAYDKNGATSDIAYRTDGIRMYATKQTTNGNKLTITAEGQVIATVVILFDEGYSATAEFIVGENTVSATDGKYTVNANAFTLFNNNSEVTSNTQVRFQSIIIIYKAVTQ